MEHITRVLAAHELGPTSKAHTPMMKRTPSRTTPFPTDWTVREARDAYLAENGFTAEAYDDKWTEGSFFGIRVSIPNTKHHRWAIMLHDLHHVVTGYGTDIIGEGEISAWEARHSIWALGPYVGGVVLFGALTGALMAPRRMLEAWRDAANVRSLHAMHPVTNDAAYETLLALSVGQLRARLGVSQEGVARLPPKLHDYAPDYAPDLGPAPPRRRSSAT
jgi:hypothetical protein